MTDPTSEAEARACADRIREGIATFAAVLADLGTAYRDRHFEILGYQDWGAYIAGEFGHVRLHVEPGDREQVLYTLWFYGMTQQEIADTIGLHQSTVSRGMHRRQKYDAEQRTETETETETEPETEPETAVSETEPEIAVSETESGVMQRHNVSAAETSGEPEPAAPEPTADINDALVTGTGTGSGGTWEEGIAEVAYKGLSPAQHASWNRLAATQALDKARSARSSIEKVVEEFAELAQSPVPLDATSLASLASALEVMAGIPVIATKAQEDMAACLAAIKAIKGAEAA